MKKWLLPSLLATAALLAAAPATAANAAANTATDTALQAAIAGTQRTPANVLRDSARHPYETLSFFGITPTQTVVELTPGGGWYTEILAPYLRERGQFIVAGEDAGSTVAYKQRGAARMKAKLEAQPAVYDKVQGAVFDADAGKLAYAKPGSVDLVLTFRNVHNWVQLGDAKTAAVFKSAFDALKPGGTLGLVEHRRPVAQTQDAKAESGYLHQAFVIKLAEAAGFKLAATSEVNANPKDKADHPNGVWALPPTYANKDVDKARFEAIGESDRMTLKFIKP
ncbi:MAG: class I SAM-dependent methyltransferase [Microbacteriaceae bacterium]|nr:class I SAM-dependent methyltransferase [Burkholderiaceae bacterium]